MTSRLSMPFLVIGTASLMACDGRNQVTNPVPPLPIPQVPGEAQFAFVQLTPRLDALVEGDTVRLKAVPIDERGSEVRVPFSVAYRSHAPSVATVSETGLVTAISRGTTEVSATIAIGNTSKRTSIGAQVFSTVSPDSIVLTSAEHGWQPPEAQVKPGGTVQWRIGSIDWAGASVTQVYLMDELGAVFDSVDVRSGSATRRLDARGFYLYCSGGCWDPPDWGVIYVR